jgi:hypothetical protein
MELISFVGLPFTSAALLPSLYHTQLQLECVLLSYFDLRDKFQGRSSKWPSTSSRSQSSPRHVISVANRLTLLSSNEALHNGFLLSPCILPTLG